MPYVLIPVRGGRGATREVYLPPDEYVEQAADFYPRIKKIRAALRQVDQTRLPNGAAFQLVANFAIAPLSVRHQNLAAAYAQVDRPGRQPIMMWANQQLEQITFEALILNDWSPGYGPVEDKLETLRIMAWMPIDVIFAYGKESNGKRWRISDFSYDTKRRDALTDETTIATGSFTLTESPPVGAQIVPGLQTIKDVTPTTRTPGVNGPPSPPAATPGDPWDRLSEESTRTFNSSGQGP